MELKDRLKEYTLDTLGLHFFGVADLEPLKDYIAEELERTVDNLSQVIVVGHRLSRAVLETIENAPNQMYKTHYQQVNYVLDRSTLKLSTLIESFGYSALPVPASHYIDKSCHRAHFSHRHAAVAAGLGWRGRNNLLITPEYGAYQRLASLITNTTLPPDKSIDQGCGDCCKCIEACPADALSPEEPYYDFERCLAQLNEFRGKHRIGHHICGLCIKPCTGTKNS